MTAWADSATAPPSRHWFAWIPLAAAGFNTLCRLGLSAALSLAAALGATFPHRGQHLRPILAVTVARSVPVHRAGRIWVCAVSYLVGGSHGQPAHAHDVANHGSAHAGGLSGGRVALIWMSLALLVAAQVWDLIRIRPRLETTS